MLVCHHMLVCHDLLRAQTRASEAPGEGCASHPESSLTSRTAWDDLRVRDGGEACPRASSYSLPLAGDGRGWHPLWLGAGQEGRDAAVGGHLGGGLDQIDPDTVSHRPGQDLLPEIAGSTRRAAVGACLPLLGEESAASGTAGCNGTWVRPEDQLADLAIPQGLDHLLRPGSNGAALRDAALQLVQDAPLLRRLCRDEDGPDLCVDLGVPLRPGVRRLVDDPVRKTLRQQRSELLQDLAMAQQNHPQVGMLVPRLLHPPGQLLVEMEDVVLAMPLDGRLLFPPALARRVLLLGDELINRVQES